MFKLYYKDFSQNHLKWYRSFTLFTLKKPTVSKTINHFVTKIFVTFFLFNFSQGFIYAESKYATDISYLVVDFKYSQKHGIKICEVQHGSLSSLLGDLYISGGDGSISPQIANFFTRFSANKWAAGLIYPPVKRSLDAKGWVFEATISKLIKDQAFLERAALIPANPFSINSYAGFVYADFDIVRNYKYFHETYPGILFLNAATFPYWRDKFKMNTLFDHNDELRQYKADWRLYPKKYDPHLAWKIQEEMPSELYVIKPRGETLANGVLVVKNSELDTVLKMILDPLPILEKHPDKRYSYWFKNKDDTFLVEKYYPSDLLSFPLPLNDKISSEEIYHYDPTMRLAFILQYEEGKMTYHRLGGFWKLPCKALEEEGTLNELRITCGEIPFYTSVEPELLNEVNAHMEQAMLLLYEEMLHENIS